jgi:hypothetical protein
MTTISKSFANSRALVLTSAVAASLLAGLIVAGQDAVQARGAGEQAEAAQIEKSAAPAEAGQSVKDCKPVRVVYGGYGEQSCKAGPEGRQG